MEWRLYGAALTTLIVWSSGRSVPIRFRMQLPAFFTSFSEVLSSGLNHKIVVEAPFRGLHKEDLIRRYQHLPIDVTLTCADPDGEVHCGACNKCFERQTAFLEAGVVDKSRYATATP